MLVLHHTSDHREGRLTGNRVTRTVDEGKRQGHKEFVVLATVQAKGAGTFKAKHRNGIRMEWNRVDVDHDCDVAGTCQVARLAGNAVADIDPAPSTK